MLRPLIAAFVVAAPAAEAAEYTLFVHETPDQLSLRADAGPSGQSYWDAYADYGRQLAAAGVLRGGAAVVPAATGAPTRLGGYFIIDVADGSAAEAWAAKAPSASTGTVEVRENGPMPTMAN